MQYESPYHCKAFITYIKRLKEPGIVYCKAKNSEGTVITQAYALLEDVSNFTSLEIVYPKEPITVGDNVSIVCSTLTVTGVFVDLIFEHDGKKYEGTVIQSDSIMRKKELAFENVGLNHTGEVLCDLYTNDKRLIERRAIYVNVTKPIAPHLRSGEISYTLIIDVLSSIDLKCDVVGTPEPRITWFKDGKPIEKDKDSSNSTTSITIQSATPTHSGRYECIAENKEGCIKITRNVTVRGEHVMSSCYLISIY